MDAAETSAWICAWFEKKGPVPGSTLEKKLATDYFAAGLIDSMGVVELVSAIEGRYGIRFTDAHFRERRFSTIGGLSAIAAELAAASPR